MDFNNFCKVTEKADAHLVFCERFDGNSNIWNFTCHNHPYLELMYFFRREGQHQHSKRKDERLPF